MSRLAPPSLERTCCSKRTRRRTTSRLHDNAPDSCCPARCACLCAARTDAGSRRAPPPRRREPRSESRASPSRCADSPTGAATRACAQRLPIRARFSWKGRGFRSLHIVSGHCTKLITVSTDLYHFTTPDTSSVTSVSSVKTV